ncbi:MAG TPA: cytosine permease [Candidatus Dormibacteraeota bacterium]|jgi:putative hydroxymethylpyrimidine transporter CytX
MAVATEAAAAHPIDRWVEPAPTLAGPVPRPLGLADQVALWGNLGVSLLGPVGALFVLAPAGAAPLSLVAAFIAVAVGTALGTLLLAASALAGAQTGAPAMVLLRGLFGARLSFLPTVLNLLQCLGWAIFELVVIAAAAEQLFPGRSRWPYVVAAGVLTTVMALRPLGVVRVLRRYALVAVVVATVYLFAQLLRHPVGSLTNGSWSGFWLAADVVIAVAVSWVPLAADYSRHSRSGRAAFLGSFLGYTVSQTAYYTLGLVAFATVVSSQGDTQTGLFAAFLAIPFGWLPFAVLVLRELDESFTNVYSTVVSVQNLRPLSDRRILAVVIGVLATVLALVLQIADYQSFLYLLGSVFVPMVAVFLVDYFLLHGRRAWDCSYDAPPRWAMLVPWALGFCTYQMVNPGSVSWWASAWSSAQRAIGFTPPTWMSASVTSFVVAAAATLVVGLLVRQRTAHSGVRLA